MHQNTLDFNHDGTFWKNIRADEQKYESKKGMPMKRRSPVDSPSVLDSKQDKVLPSVGVTAT